MAWVIHPNKRRMKKKTVFTETKKNYTKTSLGKLATLQTQRTKARKRLTRIQNQIREIENKIDEISRMLAQNNLEREWTEIYGEEPAKSIS